MLSELDLSRSLERTEYKARREELEVRLADLQQEARSLGIPVIVVFEGWGAAGKGTLINELIQPLDPRGFKVFSLHGPTPEEARRPFLWRFWIRTPERGRLAIFDRSWYRRVLNDRVDAVVRGRELRQAYTDINAFERLLADDGTVIVKFFLHISKAEQKQRFRKLCANPVTAWRVTKEDWRHHRQYGDYVEAIEAMLAETDTGFAPWTVVEAHDQRFAALKVLSTVAAALERRVVAVRENRSPAAAPSAAAEPALPRALRSSVLAGVDLTRTLPEDEYRRRLKKCQARLRELEYNLYRHGVPVMIVFEGWDAAGKGGNIRRLTREMDPRGYEVIPVAAPNQTEKAHHYLWRFWREVPKTGHLTIMDRSWYGRVLVERVEGFCTEAEWKRAYREINVMEQHLTHFGAVLLKFWLHIDADEQLRRFKERQDDPHKRWKIGKEDWRNRDKWDAYSAAAEEMILRTSTPDAPWTVVESNCKRFARIKVMTTVIAAIEKQLRRVVRRKSH